MATIQVRDVPDDVQRTYKARAAASGMSLQEYLLAELTEGARLRSPAEIVAEVADEMATEGADGFSRRSAAALIRADRARR